MSPTNQSSGVPEQGIIVSQNNLEYAGKKIEANLIQIRKSIGAHLGDYSVDPENIDITGEKLQKLAALSPGEPIIIDDRMHMAYIKDHEYHGFKRQHDEEVKKHNNLCFVRGNKVHFYYCTTLVNMSNNGLRGRYQAAGNTRNVRSIDLCDAKNVETRLAWCKHCIRILCNKGRVPIFRRILAYKSRLAEYGDAREFMACVKALYDGDANALQRTQDVFLRTMRG